MGTASIPHHCYVQIIDRYILTDSTGKVILIEPFNLKLSGKRYLAELDSTSTSIRLSPCQKYLAIGSRTGKVKLFRAEDLLDDIYLEIFDLHEDKVVDIAFISKIADTLMITISQDGFLKISSTLELKEIFKINTLLHLERVVPFKEHTIAMMSDDNQLRTIDIRPI